MIAIEERVRGIDSLTAFHRVDEFIPPERFESVVSRTYHSEILSSRKRRRFHSPHYFDASVDEYASSHHFSRRRSHSFVKEERQPRHRALHTSPKRTKKMKIDRSEYGEDSSDSSDGEFDRSRRSSLKRPKKKEETRRRRSEDFSESSFVEFEQSHRGSREKSKEKENIRSRQRYDSRDRSRVDFERSRHGSNSRQKKSSVSRKQPNRVESPRAEKPGQSRDRSRVEFDHSRHKNNSGDNKSPVSRQQHVRSESPRRATSGQLSESRDRSWVEPEHSRPNKNIRRKKSPVSRKQLSRAESPRRAKPGQLSVLEDIGTQHESLPRYVENDKPTGQISSIQQDSPRAKALIGKKRAKATSVIGEAVEVKLNSVNDLSNDIIKLDNQKVDMGNDIQAMKPATQSCWLTGEDTSDSDWDFEGPMILPPPPL
jgi:transcription elongation GreA/GreB family factor